MLNIIAITLKHVGLQDVNQRRLFNWQEIANSPVATQCDLNTLKDMQAHAAKVEFKLTSLTDFPKSCLLKIFVKNLSSARQELQQRAFVNTFQALLPDVTILNSSKLTRLVRI